MGLLDSIRDRVSSTVTQAKQTVTETVQKVEQKVEEKASAAGHAVQSAFESKPAPPPPPSAPPPPSSAPRVSSGPAGLKSALNASLKNVVEAPRPSPEASSQAAELKAKYSSWKGLDEEGLAKEMAELVKKDPVAAAPVVRELMTSLDRRDKDDVGEEFAAQLTPDQLKAFGEHPDGNAAMTEMKNELLTGVTFGHEKEMAGKLGAALEKHALPHAEMKQEPGSLGVNNEETKKTPSGKISAEDWKNPASLVSKLSQNPAAGESSGNTCAASSMLSATLMASPERAARFLENVATNPETKKLTDSERQELQKIASAVRNKTASWEDLSKAQDLLFRASNTHGDMGTLKAAVDRVPLQQPGNLLNNLTKEEDTKFRKLMTSEDPWTDAQAMEVQTLFNRITGMSMHMDKGEGGWAPRIEGGLIGLDKTGYTDDEAKNLAKLGKLSGGDTDVRQGQSLQDIAAKLKPGEVVSIRVGGSEDSTSADHFISIGRRDDGNLFITNSDPSKKDASLVVGGKGAGDENFRRILDDYGKRQPQDSGNKKYPAPVVYRID